MAIGHSTGNNADKKCQEPGVRCQQTPASQKHTASGERAFRPMLLPTIAGRGVIFGRAPAVPTGSPWATRYRRDAPKDRPACLWRKQRMELLECGRGELLSRRALVESASRGGFVTALRDGFPCRKVTYRVIAKLDDDGMFGRRLPLDLESEVTEHLA